MIISLKDAQEIYPEVTQDDLDGFETAIRELTNNPFQNRQVRFSNLRFESESEIYVFDEVQGIRKDDTIQISGSKLNDGLYVVKSVKGNKLTFEDAYFFPGTDKGAFLTKVEYPPDILSGVRKLLVYDAKMQGKIGLKSETVSRMSKTYYDQTSGETVNGYPAALMSFVNKHKLLKW